MSEILDKAKKALFKWSVGVSLNYDSYYKMRIALDKLDEYEQNEQKYEVGVKPLRIENHDEVYFECGCCGNLVGYVKITQP